MSLEDLQEHGVLLPEEEWGDHELETTVAEWPLLALFAVAVGALVLSYLGDGNLWTAVGIIAFLVSLFAIIGLCDRAVRKQRRRVRRERRE